PLAEGDGRIVPVPVAPACREQAAALPCALDALEEPSLRARAVDLDPVEARLTEVAEVSREIVRRRVGEHGEAPGGVDRDDDLGGRRHLGGHEGAGARLEVAL